MFNDAEVVVSKMCDNSIYESLGAIFQVLARDFDCLRSGNGEYPYTIQIPVFEDPERHSVNSEFFSTSMNLLKESPSPTTWNTGASITISSARHEYLM